VLSWLNLFPESFVHSTDSSSSTSVSGRQLPAANDHAIAAHGHLLRTLSRGAAKMKKQLSYADRNHIPFVVMVGENEMKEEKITLKNMQSGDQKSISQNEVRKKSVKRRLFAQLTISQKENSGNSGVFWFNYRMIFTSTAFIPFRPRSSRKVTMWSS
jgi:hypothetical protein